jgi:hypothetical protein
MKQVRLVIRLARDPTVKPICWKVDEEGKKGFNVETRTCERVSSNSWCVPFKSGSGDFPENC